MAVPFSRDYEFEYGKVDEVAPNIRRVVANNPGRFTFRGTGTYIIGKGKVAVIDPGPADPAHIDAILAATTGEQITHILITHTHGDHSPGAAPLKEATGAPTYGWGPHPTGDVPIRSKREREAANKAALEGETGPKEEGADYKFVPDVKVNDGELIQGDGWTFEALHTPGHISNHLCFSYLEEKILFSGDHVMGWSTSVIPSPDGNLTDYLANLRRLLDRDEVVYWPTHGPQITNPKEFVKALIVHREERTAQILAELQAGSRTIDEIVAVLYAEVDEALHPAAARSVLAHMVALANNGQVTGPEDQQEWLDGPWTLVQAS